MAKICTINYNTHKLVSALINSIRKFVPEYHIFVFDNSDTEPLPESDGVTVIDNTQGQHIDFVRWLSGFEQKSKWVESINNFGSAKHAYSVDKCMELIDDGFILLDSDVLLMQDITPLQDDGFLAVGEIESNRLLPYACYINTRKCKEYGVRYFDAGRMHGLTNSGWGYETGTSFLEDIQKVGQIKHVDIYKYIVHCERGSWNKDKSYADEWLKINRDLYE